MVDPCTAGGLSGLGAETVDDWLDLVAVCCGQYTLAIKIDNFSKLKRN